MYIQKIRKNIRQHQIEQRSQEGTITSSIYKRFYVLNYKDLLQKLSLKISKLYLKSVCFKHA